jgi:hypothetical protein
LSGASRTARVIEPPFANASLIVFLSFPTGANAISSHGYDPGLQLPWSQKVSENWTAAGMLSFYWPTQSGVRNLTAESTFLFDRQLTGPWDAFIEYAADFPERGGPRHLLHFGTAYKLGRLHQLDFHVGAGLSRAAVDHFIGVGYSFRFQAAEMNAFLQTINSCWGLPLPSAKWIQRRWSCAGVGR